MQKTVFEYSNYKSYLNEWIAARPQRGRGERSKIAQALRCQLSYVSQVCNGSAHLSLEQAETLSRHFGHGDEEADFFILLVSLGRAGTPQLREHYERKIKQVLERRMVLKNRLDYKKTLTPEDQATYYSAWYYTAIHFLLMIPAYQTKEALCRRLDVSPSQVSRALDFLVSRGFAEQEGARYRVSQTSIHLGSDSSMIAKHHTNWRLQAIRALDLDRPDELHYSSVVSISKKDFIKIKSLLISAIEDVRKVVRPSPEEELYCYSLDAFMV